MSTISIDDVNVNDMESISNRLKQIITRLNEISDIDEHKDEYQYLISLITTLSTIINGNEKQVFNFSFSDKGSQVNEITI